MPQKKGTLHAYFTKALAKAGQEGLPDLSCLDSDPPKKLSTPLGSAGAKLNTQAMSKTPQAAKRKGDFEEWNEASEPVTNKHRKLTTGKAVTDKRARLLDLLGEGSAQEQSLKEVRDRFSWLESKRIRDAAGRRPTDKDYDARTVLVPPEIWQKLSASQKQYWQIKQKYRDVVLFFKVGSFFELYEEDAQIGHDVLGWKLTLTGVGSCRQVGCPASGIDEAVARLTAAGYKVGRMEQTETAAEAKAKRGAKATITRTLMRVQSPATLTGAVSADAVTLLALFEQEGVCDNWEMVTQSAASRFGFAFLDAAAGRYYVGSTIDDAGRANLGAVLTQVAPKEVVHARNSLSSITARKLAAPPVPLQLSPTDPVDFAGHILLGRDAQAPLEASVHKQLFGDLQLSAAVLALGPEALAALAALVKHLRRLNADTELATSVALVMPFDLYEGAMRMDGPTLQNLDILETQDGGTRGSLLSCLDTCASAGGRRLLRSWLCRPLRNIPAINARLDAVQELSQRPDLVGDFRGALRRVPDLERMLGKVRNASCPPTRGLPDWAIKAAQQRRLDALHSAIEGVMGALEALQILTTPSEGEPVSAALLREAAGAIPANPDTLHRIKGSLDVSSQQVKSVSKAKGKQLPGRSATIAHEVLEAELQAVQAEELAANDAEEQQLEAEIRVTNRLVAAFTAETEAWEGLEGALSSVDVLCSFAAFTSCPDGPTCRPTILEPGSGPDGGACLDYGGLWHPCAVAGIGGSIVPNDLVLGTSEDSARSLLLTGPNMGGKSTMLRATCCATILAQVGCWVPAVSASLTPADRIFTRLGAQDRIVAGESTFLVECTEASSILRHATPDSLVVLDELGRGTSTFDGYAIAQAVLTYLSRTRCRLLFATHYHALTSDFGNNANVKLGHMAASVATASQAASGMPSITFLYQLLPGACPKSYGLQVAQLAGIPLSALAVADKAGLQLEKKLTAAFTGRRGALLTPDEAIVFQQAIKGLKLAAGIPFAR